MINDMLRHFCEDWPDFTKLPFCDNMLKWLQKKKESDERKRIRQEEQEERDRI